MAASTQLPLDGSVVKMKGLPFKASSEDVTRFFQGFSLRADNIYLKRHPDGRPNGEAFVIFESCEEARKATQKDRETFGDKFGDRYVRVYSTLDSDVVDMQTAFTQQNQAQHMGNGHAAGHCDSVVKIKSLPFDATQLDIIQFFDAFKLKPNGVQLVVRSDNRPTGEAFVDFENEIEAGRAIREKDHKVFSDKFGDRYVRLIQVSRKEMQATLALRFGGEGILKMKGIPFKATPQDVRKFFVGFRIKVDGISFIMHADGRPTGMAFIEFDTPQEAVRAMDKDRAKFGPEYGDRFCMLQLVGRHEMDKVALQKESDSSAQKLLAAAFATQAAMQNPALQPMLMGGGANPWLHVGAFGAALGGGGGAGAGMLDASALSAASQYTSAQYSAQLTAASQGMSALLQQQQQAAAAVAAAAAASEHDHDGEDTVDMLSWPTSHLDLGNLMSYQQAQQQQASIPNDWVRASADGRWAGPSAMAVSSLWGVETREQYDSRIRQRSASYSGTGNGRGGMHLNFAPPGAGFPGGSGASSVAVDFSALSRKPSVGSPLAGNSGLDVGMGAGW